MYTATFANQTGTQSHKHHLSLELELRIRHSTKPHNHYPGTCVHLTCTTHPVTTTFTALDH